MTPRTVAPLLLLSVYAWAVSWGAQPAPAPPLAPPRLIYQPESDWPGQRDREARVVLRIGIDRNGNVDEAVVVDGFYERRHAEAAIRFIKRCRFSPAKRGGVAEDYDGYLLAVAFRLDARGITPGFRSQLKIATDLVRAGDVDAAHAHVEHMVTDEIKTLYEIAVLQATLAETYQAMGNFQDALINSRNATQPIRPPATPWQPGQPAVQTKASNYLLPIEVVAAQLRRRIALDAKLGFTADGLEAWDTLLGLDATNSRDDLARLIPLLEAQFTDAAPLEGKARLDHNGTWSHVAYRSTFTIGDLRGGTLKRIGIACGKFQRMLDYAPDIDWTLPAGPGRCSLTFHGEPGTEFTIVEANLR